MLRIEPMYDHVLIELIKEKEKTASGLYIPASAQEKPMEGTVLAVGHGMQVQDGTLRPLKVKAGDRIIFSKYAGMELRNMGDDRLMLRESDILGIVHET